MFAVRVGDRFINLDRMVSAQFVPAEGALYLTMAVSDVEIAGSVAVARAQQERLEGVDATRVLAILDSAAKGAETSLRVMSELGAE